MVRVPGFIQEFRFGGNCEVHRGCGGCVLVTLESLTFVNRKLDVFCFNFVVSYLLLLLLCITVRLWKFVGGRD